MIWKFNDLHVNLSTIAATALHLSSENHGFSISILIYIMWLKQCHKPPMTGTGKHSTYKNGGFNHITTGKWMNPCWLPSLSRACHKFHVGFTSSCPCSHVQLVHTREGSNSSLCLFTYELKCAKKLLDAACFAHA